MLAGPDHAGFSALSDQTGEPSESWNSSLPAGAYRLYLITAGQPLDVELRVPGLEGERDLRVEHPIAVEGGPFTGAAQADGQIVGGRTIRMATYGMVWGRMTYAFPSGGSGEAGTCVYLPGHDHDRADKFADGCPGTDQVQLGPSFTSGTYTQVYGGGSADAGSRWAFGANARARQGGTPTVSGEAYAINLAPAVAPDPFPYPDGSAYATPAADRPAPSSPGPASSGPPPSTRPAAAAVIPATTVTQRAKRYALVPVACPGPVACRMSVSAGTRATRVRVAAGARTTVRVLLTVADRGRLRDGRRARPRIRVAIRGSRAVTRRVTVTAPSA